MKFLFFGYCLGIPAEFKTQDKAFQEYLVVKQHRYRLFLIESLSQIFSVNINYFHQFFEFLTFPCYIETNEVSIKQMMSAFFLLSSY